MSTSDIALLVIAGFLLALTVLFALSESALQLVSRVRAEEMTVEGLRGSTRLVRVLANAPRHLAVLLLLRVAAATTAVVAVAVVCAHQLTADWRALLVAAAGMTVLDYVFIGVGARTIARQRADTVARRTAWVVVLVTRLLGPLPQLLILLGNALTPGRGYSSGPFRSEAELRELVDMAEERQVIETDERRMIHSVFELGDTIVREVMVPRTDMVWIERTKTVRQAISLALRSGFSRIPVVGENEDDVVGVVYLKDLVRRGQDDESATKVDDVMRPAYFVPDSKPVDELLREMQTQQVHMAVVIDEYGGTAGLVTIEDILEEIVGEIADEYDREAPRVEALEDGVIRVNVRVPIDEIEEMFDVDFDLEDVDTVGGLLGSALGRVPIPGATVRLNGLSFRAESGKGRRNQVGTVLITREPDKDED